MSYKDALKDDIPIEKDKSGFNWYYPPCRICNAPVPSWNYIHGTEYTCDECREVLVKLNYQKKCTSSIDTKEEKLKKAIKRISKVTDIRHYENAIIKVQYSFDKPMYYQSTEEIMVALELLRRGLVAYHQVQVFDFRVDFVIPQLKVALEIDGAPFHRKDRLSSQMLRDEIIANKLGNGYEVIHIPTDNVNLNITKLIPAIKAVLSRRKRVQSSSC
ncbi:endonuclease domain-containing protein [Anaerocolumna sp. MB42-C2]|uniref:endonuclease domain-containing protein n=1 Tax=Anaerocolumna sp. MB42-C2 TaxID=3070997 RepID=UPI0027DF81C5|nr:DUF559 domain-containing protein [Anaerocolumna sp. MB42-C2]WMJ87773.1 DUF559 domain-containing protein [Anaerocolumna sp. MB42-C2]